MADLGMNAAPLTTMTMPLDHDVGFVPYPLIGLRSTRSPVKDRGPVPVRHL